MSLGSKKEEYFSNWFERDKFSKTLGITLKELHPDKIILEMDVNPEKHLNYMGSVHGGAITAFADKAMGAACVNMGNLVTTIDLNINFIRKIMPPGTIRAVAGVLHQGRQTVVAETEIYDGNNQLAAKARGTFFVLG